MLYDSTTRDTCGHTYTYLPYTERNVARLLATHVVIRNVQVFYDTRQVTLDLYTNFIQTDRDSALGHPQERRLVASGPSWSDTLFMLYQSGNVIYLSRATGAPDDLGWTWEAAWPMDTLGHHPALARFTEWRWISGDEGPSSLLPFRRLCAVYAHETHLFRSCWWEDTTGSSMLWRWVPRETLRTFTLPISFHTLTTTDTFLHHVVLLQEGTAVGVYWLRSGPQAVHHQVLVDRFEGGLGEADVAALDSGRVALVYARGPEIWAAFRSGGTWNRLLFSTSGTTPLVDTLAGGYLFAWQEGDSIRVVWRDERGKGGSPYGLTNGTLLALEGGVVLYRRSPLLRPPAPGLFKRVYDGTSWGPEDYLMAPGNLTGFHIAPTGDGQVRMVAVQPTGWIGEIYPSHRIIDFAETGMGGSQAGEVRVHPTLVVRPFPGGLAVQVGSGWPGVRYALFDAAGRRVADVRVEGIRAVLPVPRSGVYVLRATLPDGRTLRKKVMFAR